MAAYDRQPKEPEKAYQLFLYYRQTRNIAEVSRRTGHARSYIQELKDKWDWAARCEAYDAEFETVGLAKHRMFAEPRDDIFSEAITERLRSKLAVADSILQAELMTMKQAQDKGEPVDLLKMKRLISAIADADSLARRSAGMPTAYRSATADSSAGSAHEAEQVYFVGGSTDEADT